MANNHEKLQKDNIESEMLQSGTEEGFSGLDCEYIGPSVVTEEATRKKPDEKTPEEKKKNRRILFKLIISSILLLLLIFIIVSRREAEAPIFTYLSDNAIQIHSDEAVEETYIYNYRGEKLHTIDMYTSYFYYNLDHTAAAIAFTERISRISIYSLYYVNASEVLLLRRGISTIAISDSGNYVMYSQKQPQGGSTLFLLNTKDKTEVELDSGKQNYTALCFSPDENTILYASETLSNTKGLSTKIEGYMIRDISSGNLMPLSIGADRLPVAVSDGAELIYFGLYINNSPGHLYVKYNDETTKLSENYSKVFFNRDHTEMIYYDGAVTKICLRGTEMKELTKNTLTGIILPDKGTQKVDYMYRSGAFTYGIESFRNIVILSDDGSLLFINEQFNPIQIDMVNGEEPIRVSKDVNTIIYLNTKETLLKVNNLRGSWKTEVVKKDVNHWMSSEDMTQIYYIQDGTLYFYRGKEEPQYVMKGADRLFQQANGTDIFVLTGKEGEWNLYTCSQGVPLPVETVGVINAIEYNRYGVAFRQDFSDNIQRYYYPSIRNYNEN